AHRDELLDGAGDADQGGEIVGVGRGRNYIFGIVGLLHGGGEALGDQGIELAVGRADALDVRATDVDGRELAPTDAGGELVDTSDERRPLHSARILQLPPAAAYRQPLTVRPSYGDSIPAPRVADGGYAPRAPT